MVPSRVPARYPGVEVIAPRAEEQQALVCRSYARLFLESFVDLADWRVRWSRGQSSMGKGLTMTNAEDALD